MCVKVDALFSSTFLRGRVRPGSRNEAESCFYPTGDPSSNLASCITQQPTRCCQEDLSARDGGSQGHQKALFGECFRNGNIYLFSIVFSHSSSKEPETCTMFLSAPSGCIFTTALWGRLGYELVTGHPVGCERSTRS